MDKNEYVNALKARLREYLNSIEQDQKKVREMLESIEKKDQQVVHIQKLLEAEGLNLVDEGIEIAGEISLADIAYDVLDSEANRKPVHYRDLAKMIFKQGKNIPGKDPAANLIAHLGRDNRFERTGRGLYGLKEWGIKPEKKKRRKSRKRRPSKKVDLKRANGIENEQHEK